MELQLSIEGVICQPVIGWYSNERHRPQEIHVDLKLDFTNQVSDDDLATTIDYHSISLVLQQKINNTRFKLLESLAQFVAKIILADFSLVNKVNVTLSKPSINDTFARRVSCNYTLCRRYHVALALGSNLNNPQQQLINAIELLHPLLHNLRVSGVYKTLAYGFEHQQNFYNACISGDVTFLPHQLLAEVKKIEKIMGKVEQFSNGPRLIDIDILFYDQLIYQQYFLSIPHSRLHLRDFVLRPLADIEPNWQHPQLGLSLEELLANLPAADLTIIEKVAEAPHAHIC